MKEGIDEGVNEGMKVNKKSINSIVLSLVLIFIAILILVYPSLYDYLCKNRVYGDLESNIDQIWSANICIIDVESKDDCTSYGVGSSGVIFDKDEDKDTYYVMTASHVVKGEKTSYKAFTVNTPTYSQYKEETGIDEDNHIPNEQYYGIMSDMKVEYVSDTSDLAILSFVSDEDLKAVSLAEENPEKGDRILNIGNPENAEGEKFSVSYGKIKSNLTTFKADGESDESEDIVLKHNAYEAPGSSGSAVYNDNFQLVGIDIGGGRDAFHRFKYGVMIPCDQIKDCINDWKETE